MRSFEALERILEDDFDAILDGAVSGID